MGMEALGSMGLISGFVLCIKGRGCGCLLEGSFG